MIISLILSGVSLFIIGLLEKKIGGKFFSPPMKSVIDFVSTDCRCGECYRGRLSSSKVEREVVSVALVHHFHTKTSAVENVCPGVQDTTLTINDGLVEVETVEVECHGAYAQCSEPDANDRPCCQEEVK